jgi:hypothetical protein
VEFFHFLAYQAGLRLEDLHLLTIGMVLDFIEEYVDQRNPKKKRKRAATQADFDAF